MSGSSQYRLMDLRLESLVSRWVDQVQYHLLSLEIGGQASETLSALLLVIEYGGFALMVLAHYHWT
jgi:hypothetical protein